MSDQPSTPPQDDSNATLMLSDESLAALGRAAMEEPTVISSAGAGELRSGIFIGADPKEIGPYQIEKRIGEGGFGTVYRARQTEPIRREVALKIVRAGMSSSEVLARFEVERQTLALMQHPHIAGVLDAGTTSDGRPYFVMELVKGTPATQYCNEHRLSVRQRVELFISVCQAVQHAHQKGVLHRDLKPSNILVTEVDGRPVAKVIDFGIAKAIGGSNADAMADTLLQTRIGSVIGTPQYMSPEQAGAAPDLDTRSDVYSLGIILFELLTGETPLTLDRLKRAAMDEVLRLIREAETDRPSSRLAPVTKAVEDVAERCHTEPRKLVNAVRGDLDWIVLKALEKERERRYPSAESLALDLQRHLRNEPVSAGPPDALYRFRKLVRRNRLAFAAGSLVCLSLLTGMGATFWQWRHADAERHRAEQGESALAERLKEASRVSVGVALDHRDKNRDPSAAIGHLVKALDYAPDNARAQFELTDLLMQSLGALPRLSRVPSIKYEDVGGGPTPHSPDRRHLFLLAGEPGQSSVLQIWDTTTGRMTGQHAWPGQRLGTPEFTSDEHRALVRFEDHMQMWDLAEGKAVGAAIPVPGHENNRATISADGRRVVTWDLRWDDTAHQIATIWDADTGRPVGQPLDHQSDRQNRLWGLNSASFSADGRRILTVTGDQTAHLWNAETGARVGKPLKHPDDPRNTLFEAGFSPDSRRVFTAAFDGSAQLWDAETGAPVGTRIQHGKGGTTAAFSPSGRRLVTGCVDHNAQVWDASTGAAVGKPIRSESGVWHVGFSPDETLVVTITGAGTALLWDADSGESRSPPFNHGAGILAFDFSPDGLVLMTQGRDAVYLWNVVNGRASGQPIRCASEIRKAVFSDDGSTLLVSSRDHMQSYPVAACRNIRRHFFNFKSEAAFSSDGKTVLLTGYKPDTTGSTLQAWDVTTGEPLRQPIEFIANINLIALSPNARHAAVHCSQKEGEPANAVEMIDLDSGRRFVLKGQPMQGLNTLSFSPDGKLLVTIHDDGQRKRGIASVWNATTGELVMPPIEHPFQVTKAVFSPDSHYLLTAWPSGGAQLWDLGAKQAIGIAMLHDKSSVIIGAAFDEHELKFTTVSYDVINRDSKALLEKWAFAPLPATAPVLLSNVEAALGFMAHTTRPRPAMDFHLIPHSSLASIGFLHSSRSASHRVVDTATGELWGMLGNGQQSGVFVSPDARWFLSTGNSTPALCELASGIRQYRAFPREWLPVVEAIAGVQITHAGTQAIVPDDERLARCERWKAQRQTWTHDPETADWVRLIDWCLAEPVTRTLSPHSQESVAHYVDRQIALYAESPDQVPWGAIPESHDLDPTNPLVHLALAQKEDNPANAAFLRQWALKQLEHQPEMRRRAEELKLLPKP